MSLNEIHRKLNLAIESLATAKGIEEHDKAEQSCKELLKELKTASKEISSIRENIVKTQIKD